MSKNDNLNKLNTPESCPTMKQDEIDCFQFYRQNPNDMANEKQKYGFCYFLQLFGICAIVVIPFYFFYDSVLFSDLIIWWIEFLGDK